ncbi:MAG TPA: lipoyl domain-containing protein [Propionicimonas sp.]|uniref:lipoyl domain-containing protein n=1 Tax=Propionicimonas sp. TaxID=1955623 RepID=UPI002F40B6DF
MTEVLFPTLSRERPDAEGVVATWFVDDGQVVTTGHLLAEVQVDKVSQEITAPAAGVVHILTVEGDAARQGSAIAEIS